MVTPVMITSSKMICIQALFAFFRALRGFTRDPGYNAKIPRCFFFYALSAFAISGATDTVLTPLSRVSVASTASTPER